MEKTIVIEIGEVLIKLGIGGEVNPRLICNSSDYLLYDDGTNKNLLKDKLQYMFTVFFSQYIPFKSKDCRVLVIEKLLSTKILRDCVVSTLLLDFQVLSISLQPDLLMPILTSTKSSGIIIDIGINESIVIAIAYGYIILQSLKVAAVGINNCNEKFKKKIEMIIGHEVDSKSSKDLFHKITFCPESELESKDLYIAPREGLSKFGFVISTKQSSSCFNHLVCGTIEDDNDKDEIGGVSSAILECLRACPYDVRSLVSSNIMFCGEGSDIPGLPSSIYREATIKLKSDRKYEKIKEIVNTFTIEENNYKNSNLAWIGGSLFSSLKSNDKKFLKLRDITNKGIADESSSSTFLDAPDWMDITSPNEWIFFGPSTLRSKE